MKIKFRAPAHAEAGKEVFIRGQVFECYEHYGKLWVEGEIEDSLVEMWNHQFGAVPVLEEKITEITPVWKLPDEEKPKRIRRDYLKKSPGKRVPVASKSKAKKEAE